MDEALDFSALQRQHERLRSLARALVGDEHRAEDLAQDAWVRALDRGPDEPAALGAWLASVARRLASNGRRGRRRRDERERAVARDEALPSSAEIAARVEVEARLLAALESLDEPHCTLLRDRYLGELSPAQLAARDELSLEAVKSRLRRARAALREQLEQGGLGDEPRWQRALGALVLGPAAASTPVPPTAAILGTAIAMKKLAFAIVLVVVAGLAAWRVAVDAERPAASAEALAPRGDAPPGLAPDAPRETPAAAEADPADEAAQVPARAVQPAPEERAWKLTGLARRSGGGGFAGLPMTVLMYRGFELAGEPLARFELESDAEGRFELLLERPGETVCFDIEVEPDPSRDVVVYEPYVVPRDEAEPEPLNLLVRPLDARVEGVVLGPDGRSVPGAEVAGMAGSATCDVEGRFSMVVCGSTHGKILASAKGLGEAEQVVERLAPGGSVRLELRLGPEATLSGLVTDVEGRPLRDALVWLSGDAQRSARTDGAGRYAFDRLPLRSGAWFGVSASKDGFVAGSRELALDGAQASFSADFELARGVRVHGRVLDPEGAPVPAAAVWLGQGPYALGKVATRTDDEGRFSLDGVRPGRTRFGAARRGFAEATGEVEVHDGAELLLSLERPRTVRGVARDERGEPIEGLGLAAKQGDEYVGGQAHTDSQGVFELGGLPPRGDLRLEAWGVGRVRTYLDVREGEAQDLVLVVPRSGALAGRVIDAASGAPIETFTVRIAWPSVPVEGETLGGIESSWVDPGRSFDDAEGRWSTGERDELQPGVWAAVEVSAPGYATRRIEAVQVSPLDDVVELVHELVPPVRLEVSLRSDPGDEPVVGARVEAWRTHLPGEEAVIASAETGAAGLALLERLSTGPLHVRVRREGRADLSHGPFEIAEQPSLQTLELRVPVGQPVEVLLLDAKGAPRAGERVQLFASQVEGSDGANLFAMTDADGLARFDGVAPGRWLPSRAVGAGEWPAPDLRRTLEVVAESAPERVVLAPGGEATLVVRIESELEVPDGTVVRLSSGLSARAATTAGGVATVERLAAGTWSVELWFHHAGTGRVLRGTARVEVRAGDGRVELEVEAIARER